MDLLNTLEKSALINSCKELFKQLEAMDVQSKVEALNDIRFALLEHSPFKNEPVDFVRWISSNLVNANDYNPNSVAPPEMKLLEHSITEDGYTQPIVSWSRDGIFEVVDGFHRHRVGKESETVRARVHGYLPAVVINSNREGKNDRMASTIRHNRARGEHKVESMSEIVVELKRRFWSDEKIAKELGMDSDEVLRLQQVTGLSGLFTDAEFSEAWEAETFEEVAGVDEPLS
jgi:ParB-like chromosome segregation protein Spo0J